MTGLARNKHYAYKFHITNFAKRDPLPFSNYNNKLSDFIYQAPRILE